MLRVAQGIRGTGQRTAPHRRSVAGLSPQSQHLSTRVLIQRRGACAMLGKAKTVVASEEPESRGDNILRTAGMNATLSAPRHWSLAVCRQRQEELFLAVVSKRRTYTIAEKRSDVVLRYVGPPSPKHSKQRDGVSLCAEKQPTAPCCCCSLSTNVG